MVANVNEVQLGPIKFLPIFSTHMEPVHPISSPSLQTPQVVIDINDMLIPTTAMAGHTLCSEMTQHE